MGHVDGPEGGREEEICVHQYLRDQGLEVAKNMAISGLSPVSCFEFMRPRNP